MKQLMFDISFRYVLHINRLVSASLQYKTLKQFHDNFILFICLNKMKFYKNILTPIKCKEQFTYKLNET